MVERKIGDAKGARGCRLFRHASTPAHRVHQGLAAGRQLVWRRGCHQLAEFTRSIACATPCDWTGTARELAARLGAPAIGRVPIDPRPGHSEFEKTSAGSFEFCRKYKRHGRLALGWLDPRCGSPLETGCVSANAAGAERGSRARPD